MANLRKVKWENGECEKAREIGNLDTPITMHVKVGFPYEVPTFDTWEEAVEHAKREGPKYPNDAFAHVEKYGAFTTIDIDGFRPVICVRISDPLE